MGDRLLNQGELVESVVEYVTHRDWVSFVELRNYAEQRGVPVDGHYAIEACPNGVVWAGVSEEFADLVDALRDDGRLGWEGGSVLAYMADGGLLRFPVAKRAPRDPVKGYAKPYWIPTFFRPRERIQA